MNGPFSWLPGGSPSFGSLGTYVPPNMPQVPPNLLGGLSGPGNIPLPMARPPGLGATPPVASANSPPPATPGAPLPLAPPNQGQQYGPPMPQYGGLLGMLGVPAVGGAADFLSKIGLGPHLPSAAQGGPSGGLPPTPQNAGMWPGGGGGGSNPILAQMMQQLLAGQKMQPPPPLQLMPMGTMR